MLIKKCSIKVESIHWTRFKFQDKTVIPTLHFQGQNQTFQRLDSIYIKFKHFQSLQAPKWSLILTRACTSYLCTITCRRFGIWFHLWTTRIPIPRAEAGWKQNTGDDKPGGDTRNYVTCQVMWIPVDCSFCQLFKHSVIYLKARMHFQAYVCPHIAKYQVNPYTPWVLTSFLLFKMIPSSGVVGVAVHFPTFHSVDWRSYLR